MLPSTFGGQCGVLSAVPSGAVTPECGVSSAVLLSAPKEEKRLETNQTSLEPIKLVYLFTHKLLFKGDHKFKEI